jgi:hypothetical protein
MIYKNIIARSKLLLALLTFLFLTPAPLYAIAASASISVWWPTNGAHVQNVQPLKGVVSGLDVTQYEMFWQVDGGTVELDG